MISSRQHSMGLTLPAGLPVSAGLCIHESALPCGSSPLGKRLAPVSTQQSAVLRWIGGRGSFYLPETIGVNANKAV